MIARLPECLYAKSSIVKAPETVGAFVSIPQIPLNKQGVL